MTDSTPPVGITPEMLRKWRTPIRGALNPQLMTNPVWKWLIESRLHAHQANALFSGDSMTSEAPVWCFDRFGQSCTPLPDGRTVWIAGEHEDYYHPDFFIYNDHLSCLHVHSTAFQSNRPALAGLAGGA
jgi:hypothetical protein